MRISKQYTAASISFFCLLLSGLDAATYTVTTNGDNGTDSTTFRYALLHAVAGDVIDFDVSLSGGTITLLHSLPAITQNLTITGPAVPLTIEGGGTYQAFSVGNGTVAITNLNVNNALSIGGAGGGGRNAGGGGAGGGAALYIQKGTMVSIGGATLSNNTAQGGVGGAGFYLSGSNVGGGGGGGGFGENGSNRGGNAFVSGAGGNSGGGGGGHTAAGAGGDGSNSGGVGAAGGIANQTAGGGGGGGTGANNSYKQVKGGGAAYKLPLANSTYPGGTANTTTSSPGNGGGGAGLGGAGGNYTATAGGVGGPGIGSGALFGGGGGGGGGAASPYSDLFTGGAGTGAGGGGGAGTGPGGAGGDDGGGGGGGGNGNINNPISSAGGNGGFGGGGGGGNPGGTSSFGGGAGGSGGSNSYANGGGGAGMGGAIFIQENATLVIQDAVSFSSNTAFGGAAGTGGSGGSAGQAYGFDLFMKSGAQVTFENSSPMTISTNIDSDQVSGMGGGITMAGVSVLTLGGTNTYTGTTTITSGTISITSDANLGKASNPVKIQNGTLEIANSLSSARTFNLTGAAGVQVDAGTATLSGTIQGVGSLAKSGAGILDFSNAQVTYSGGTAIQAGTLTLSGTSTLVPTGSLDISSGATFDISSSPQTQVIGDLTGAVMSTIDLGANQLQFGTGNASPQTFAGAINGSGSVLKQGTGTAIFTGASTYTGGTFIEQGTLSLTGLSSLDSMGAVNIAAGATFDVSGSTGAQTIGDLIGAALSTVNLGPTPLVFGTANNTTFAGKAIGAAGSMHKTGSGTVTFTGANTYGGGTFLDGGVLNINTNSALGASAGIVSVIANSTLQLAGDINMNRVMSIDPGVTFTVDTNGYGLSESGVIAGAGALTKIGKGRLTLSGVNTYSGLTTVSKGVLSLPSSGQIAGDVELQTGTVLRGAGGILGDVLVHAGALLQGTEVINGAVTIQNGGVIRAGNPIGTMTVGSLTLNPLSTTVISISPSHTSLIDVTSATPGSATLAGELLVHVGFGTYALPTNYTILHSASTITTMFNNPPVFVGDQRVDAILVYHPNDVILQINKVGFCTINTNLLNGNENGVHIANYLNSFNMDPVLGPIVCEMSKFSPGELNSALNSISPARNAISSYIGQNTMFLIANTVSCRTAQQRVMMREAQYGSVVSLDLFRDLPAKPVPLMLSAVRSASMTLPSDADSLYWKGLTAHRDSFGSDLTPDADGEVVIANEPSPQGSAQTFAHKTDNYAVWVEGLGEFIRQDEQHQNPSYHSNTGGVLLGFDYYGQDQWMLGAAVCYAKSFIHENQHAGKATIDSYAATLYGTAEFCDGYIELGLAGAYNTFENTRFVQFAQFDTSADSSHAGAQVVPHLAAGYDINYDWGALEPFVSFDCAILFQDSFSEHGAGVWNMHQAGSTSELLRSEAGLSAYEVWNTCSGDFILRETLSYVNKQPFQVGHIQANLVNYPVGFTVSSFVRNESFISPTVEFLYRGKQGEFVSIFYMGEFQGWSSKYMSNNVLVKIGMYF